MKLFRDTNKFDKLLEDFKKEKKELKINDQHKVLLLDEEIELFFKKVDIIKFSDRIYKHYKIYTEEKFNKFIGIEKQSILNKEELNLAIKNKYIIKNILSNDEKIQLKSLYIKEVKEEIEFVSFNKIWANELNERINLKTLESKVYKYFNVVNYVELCAKLKLSTNNSYTTREQHIKKLMIEHNLYKISFPREEIVKIMNKIYNKAFASLQKEYIKYGNFIAKPSPVELDSLELDHLTLMEHVKSVVEENKRPTNMLYINKTKNINTLYVLKKKFSLTFNLLKSERIEKLKTIKQQPSASKKNIKEILNEKKLKLEAIKNKKQEYSNEELEILKRIEKRKKQDIGALTHKINKNEKVVIEVHFEDFNSRKSRLTLSALSGINFNMTFFDGIIKFMSDTGTIEEIFFEATDDSMIFHIKDFEIELRLNSIKTVDELLKSQTQDKSVLNTTLNCLSVLYYINSYFSDTERIDVQNHDLSYIGNTVKDLSTSSNSDKSTIYLNEKNNRSIIKTIKIKKGKKIEGKSLTRGHWRNQPYSDGSIKLIWINPFWRGKGKQKTRTYKVGNNI